MTDWRTEGCYMLAGHEPVPAADWEAWASWYETADRHLGLDPVGPYLVSTVFTGRDLNVAPGAGPVLFESIVFGPDEQELARERYRSYDQALAGHQAMVALARIAAEV